MASCIYLLSFCPWLQHTLLQPPHLKHPCNIVVHHFPMPISCFLSNKYVFTKGCTTICYNSIETHRDDEHHVDNIDWCINVASCLHASITPQLIRRGHPHGTKRLRCAETESTGTHCLYTWRWKYQILSSKTKRLNLPILKWKKSNLILKK